VASGKAEHEIHVLHRLALMRPFIRLSITDSTVSVSPPPVRFARTMHSDAAHVSGARRSRVGLAACRHHIDERLLRITLFEQRLEIHFLDDAAV
jgi:hypothetical protein